MSTMHFIRTKIFKVNQIEFAAIVGVGQATISRWDQGKTSPDLANLQRIRAAAAQRGIPWDHSWFFDAAPIEKRSAA